MAEDRRWWPSRYGPGDERGSLNEISAAKIVAAARLVRAGRVYDLGRTLHADVPRFAERFWRQTLVTNAHITNARRQGSDGDGWGKNHLNWVTEMVTGTLQIGTQLDGLNHLQIGDRFYNGWRAAEIVEDWGTNRLGIETVPPVVTRGVLIDIARHRGVAMLAAGDVIEAEELEQTLREQETALSPGDVLLVHTGWGALWSEDPVRFTAGEPGIGIGAARWLVERRVAMTGADTWSFGPVPAEDPDFPFLVPQTLNVEHGLFIMENLATEALAADRLYEFMFVLTHQKTRGSTAAIIAPAAVI